MSKNKKIKRIICIFFVTIICFSTACVDACFESCHDIINSKWIKMGKEEAEKQKKALDSAPIEVEGYKLKFDKRWDLYKTDNSWISLSYNYRSVTFEYDGKMATLEVFSEYISEGIKSHDVFCLTETVEDEIVEKKLPIDWFKIGFEYDTIEGINPNDISSDSGIYCLDGVWFLVYQYVCEITVWERDACYTATLDFPPLFYMLDFENQKLLYAGYADGWYDYVEKEKYCGRMWPTPAVKVEKI